MKWTLYHHQQFDLVAQHWDDLNLKSNQQPILDSAYVAICLEVFANGTEFIAYCEDDKGPLAIGIFHRIRFGHYATFQPSQAPLGLFIARDNQLSNTLLHSLIKALPGLVIHIDFLQQDTDIITFDDSTMLATDYITTGKLAVAQDFSEFFAGLGKNMRQNYNKVINRSAKQGQILSTHRQVHPLDVVAAVALFGQFESSGWKGEGGTAVNIDNQQGQFYVKLLQHYAHNNRAEIWHYQVDGQTVAIDLCIKSAQTLIILKTAYDEQFKKLSPALQLKFEILRHHAALTGEKRLHHVEFFGKAMEWHKRFNSQLRPIKHLSYFSHRIWLNLYRWLKR